MAIYAIADLHLSFNKKVDPDNINPDTDINKPMDLFGWGDHYHRIRENWLKKITEEDTVLIPGDISWAMKIDEAANDFHWIAQLPGRKILSPGNHEYYAGSKRKVRNMLPERMEWIDADFTTAEGYVIAGTRGWCLPGERGYTEEEDRKIYERQAGRLEMALSAAKKAHPEREIIAMLHFPPISRYATESKFMDLLVEYQVSYCVYGHLHGELAHKEAMVGEIRGVSCHLVSCDAIKFDPLLLI